MAGLKRITDLLAASTLLGDELLEVSQVSTTVFRNATTISAQASDNSFNDSASQFLVGGFAVGDRVRVTGFTSNPANNILVGTVTAVTAGKMTIGGTDGDVIVDETAGLSISIRKWTSRRALLSDIGIGGGGGTGNYDMRFGFVATPTANQVIDTVMVGRALTLPANMTGSLGRVGTNPTASFVMSLQDDGVTIGTITVSTAGVFTFTTTSGTEKLITVPTVLTLIAPASVDATIANMSLTLLMTET